MKPYFGHEKNVKAVKAHLPRVMLFVGPESVGKWELAEYVRSKWDFKNVDTLRIKRLTQDNARAIVSFAAGRPQGFSKLVIVRIDRKATKGAQNALLKALEEARDVVFILVAEEMPLETIKSRSIVYPFGLLSEQDVYNILTVRKNFASDRAHILAHVSGGQVKRALSYSKSQDNKKVVLKALDAVARKDNSALEATATQWQQDHTELLIQWCYESLTQNWQLFTEEETTIRGSKIPLRILIAIREDLRPRLIVRAALASVLQEA